MANKDRMGTNPFEKTINKLASGEKKETSKKPAVKVSKENTKPQKANTAKAGLPEGFTRATIIVSEEALRKVKTISSITGSPIKDIVSNGIDREIKAYEKN